MWTGIVVAVLAVLFVVGTMMSLRPSAHEKALGTLRAEARAMKLNPRLVACPDWLINADGVKGKGMVALYSVAAAQGGKLPLMDALVIDDVIKVVKGDATTANPLANARCGMKGALGIVMQGDFAGMYWDENVLDLESSTAESRAEKLAGIKENLQSWVKKVQA